MYDKVYCVMNVFEESVSIKEFFRIFEFNFSRNNLKECLLFGMLILLIIVGFMGKN